MYKPINFNSKFKLFSDLWSPKVIAELNDYQFKLVKIKDEFINHRHVETDEAFIVIDGSMSIEFIDEIVDLNKGEMIVVKKGEYHKPYALKECKVLIVEPRNISNTGQLRGPLSAKNDVWIWNYRFYIIIDF